MVICRVVPDFDRKRSLKCREYDVTGQPFRGSFDSVLGSVAASDLDILELYVPRFVPNLLRSPLGREDSHVVLCGVPRADLPAGLRHPRNTTLFRRRIDADLPQQPIRHLRARIPQRNLRRTRRSRRRPLGRSLTARDRRHQHHCRAQSQHHTPRHPLPLRVLSTCLSTPPYRAAENGGIGAPGRCACSSSWTRQPLSRFHRSKARSIHGAVDSGRQRGAIRFRPIAPDAARSPYERSSGERAWARGSAKRYWAAA